MKRYTGLEQVINIYDGETFFYHLHYFPSYEISNATSLHGHLIRSFKSAHKYPFGIVVKPLKRFNYEDPVYELTDINNDRKIVRLSELLYMANNPPYPVNGYPRAPYIVDNKCRNDKTFIVSNKKIRKRKQMELANSELIIPKFRIIDDEDSKQEAIKFIDWSNIDGRKDY